MISPHVQGPPQAAQVDALRCPHCGIGVPDLSLALRYTEGYDRQLALTGENLGDRRELNATIDYQLRHGPLRGFWLRARFGWGQVEGSRRDSFEGRIILRYDLRLL